MQYLVTGKKEKSGQGRLENDVFHAKYQSGTHRRYRLQRGGIENEVDESLMYPQKKKKEWKPIDASLMVSSRDWGQIISSMLRMVQDNTPQFVFMMAYR